MVSPSGFFFFRQLSVISVFPLVKQEDQAILIPAQTFESWIAKRAVKSRAYSSLVFYITIGRLEPGIIKKK
jgi:hypothetical protein